MQDETTPTPEEILPGPEPTVVVRQTQAGPMPVEPMKEGPAGIMPVWLEPYVKDRPQVRARLLPEQRIFFDSLWDRATGLKAPGLSGREQLALLAIIKGERP